MNEETNTILKEIRDLQKETIENQRKVFDYAQKQQKGLTKKLIFIFVAVFILTFLINIFLR